MAGLAAGCTLAVQMVSATLLVDDFETPNVSTRIARNLATSGSFLEPLAGVGADGTARVPPRAFQLPGEPLYLAAGFAVLPAVVRRYLHVPIVVLLVTALTAIAYAVGGWRVAVAAGTIALVDPFLVVHGPVWDDTVLAAALEWLLLAILAWRMRSPAVSGSPWWLLALVAGAAGWAAVTRLQSQVILGTIGVLTIAMPRFRAVRGVGWAALAGLGAAVGLWGLRNLLVLGVFFIGSTHDGQTLLQSNHPRAWTAIVETGVSQSYADISVPEGLGEIERDAVLRDRAIDYLRTSPIDAARTALLKVAVSLTGFDFGHPALSVRNVAAVFSNVLLWGLALWGVTKGLFSDRTSDPLALFRVWSGVTALVVTGMLLIGPVGLRYRVSLAPVLYIAAAWALCARPSEAGAQVPAPR